MQKLKTYVRALLASLSNPDYYFLVLKTKFQVSVFFFVITLALVSGLTAIWGGLYTWPAIVTTIQETGNDFLGQVPEDAKFQYKEGTLSTTIDLPFVIESPKALSDFEFPKQFAGINSKDEALESFLTFSPKSVFVRSQGQVDSIHYTDIVTEDAASFTKKDLVTLLGTVTSFMRKNAWQIVTFLSAIWFVSKIVSGLLLIALYTFIVQSIGWVIGVRLKYWQVFRWGLHIYPIAVAVDFISSILTQQNYFPLVSLVYLAFSLVILWRARTLQRTIHRV